MTESIHLVCPHCRSINRVPTARLAQQPRCGQCHGSLFSGHPIALTAKDFDLHAQRAEIPLLVDFWASWCGPCRMENPNVVKAYQKYKAAKYQKAKGFTVYSVSLDKAKDPWMNAIKQDGLEWPNHVSDLKWWYSDAARLYNVQSIPANWLIDGNGIIIGRDLRGPALEQALEGQLAK